MFIPIRSPHVPKIFSNPPTFIPFFPHLPRVLLGPSPRNAGPDPRTRHLPIDARGRAMVHRDGQVAALVEASEPRKFSGHRCESRVARD